MRTYILNSNEPVRIGALLLGAVVSSSTFLLAWGAGQDWRLAAGAALAHLAVAVGGGEAVAAQTWGPRTVDTIIDAEAVIQAQGDDD